MNGVGAVVAKPRLSIVGAGGHEQSVAEAVQLSGDFDLVGFLDDGAFAIRVDVLGFQVLGSADALGNYAALASHELVAIGNNALHQNLCGQLQSAGFTLASLVHLSSILSPHAKLGDGWSDCVHRGVVGAGCHCQLRCGCGSPSPSA